MSNNISWKNFYLCFPKLKFFPMALPPPNSPSKQHHNNSSSSITSTTTTTTSSRHQTKNIINSIYDITSTSTSTSKSHSSAADDFFSTSEESDSESPPDLATIFASQRFFCSSPGRSKSIVESPNSPTESDALVAGSIAVETYSPDPYIDFRRSMQEMMESRGITDLKADRNFLHELLICYLTLNPKHTHKFIISAFSDLLVSNV